MKLFYKIVKFPEQIDELGEDVPIEEFRKLYVNEVTISINEEYTRGFIAAKFLIMWSAIFKLP